MLKTSIKTIIRQLLVFSINCIKMKLIVLIVLIGCALAIPNPFPEEKFGPANGLRIPGIIY